VYIHVKQCLEKNFLHPKKHLIIVQFKGISNWTSKIDLVDLSYHHANPVSTNNAVIQGLRQYKIGGSRAVRL
jgi:hypothetical protein